MNDDIRPAVGRADGTTLQRERPAIIPRDRLEVFRTPDAVAAHQFEEENNIVEPAQPSTTVENIDPQATPTHKQRGDRRQSVANRWPPTRKELWIASSVVLVLSLVSAVLLTHHSPKKVVTHNIIKPIVKPIGPSTVPSALSGLPVSPSTNARPVTGVMIENSLDARPQSGLSQASVVFEAIAEGGITRFLALFQDTAPADVGPIRSARPYYVQWALGFDAAYAHVGGSPEALTDIKTWGVRDLDQFANGASYHRVSSRAAPHNVYTSIDALNQLESAKGFTSSTFTGFSRKKLAPLKIPSAKTIDIAISGPLYNVHYDYNPANNSYNRSEGGAPHIDANGSTLITPAVVIVMVMPYGLEADDHHSQYGTIGSGQAYIFQDGGVVSGKWTKATEKTPFTFTDASGNPQALNPGQTWLTAVGNANSVKSSP